MSKIWLINPPMSPEEMFVQGVKGSASIIPPLGIAYIAAYLIQNGHECEILDGVVESLPVDEIAKKSLGFDMVFITVVSAYYLRAVELVKAFKAVPGTPPVVVGGPHVTATQEEILREGADIAVIGEGEETALELVGIHRRGEGRIDPAELAGIAGIAFLDAGGKLATTKSRPLIEHLDMLPPPARHLLPMHKYSCSIARSARTPSLSIMTSRGCPGCCTFCNHKTFGNKVRYLSPARIVDEIMELVHSYGANDISFWDDNFLANRDVVIETCRMLKERGFDKTFSVEARVDCVDPEMLRALRWAGCEYISYGFESGSQRILDQIRKKETLGQMREAVRMTKEAGLRIRGYFIIGFPRETREEILQTIAFAKELDIDMPTFTVFVPFPGAADYILAQKEGTFDPDFYKKRIIPEFNFIDSLVYIPAGFTEEEILRLHKLAYRSCYFRPRTILRHLRNIRSVHDVSHLLQGGATLLMNALGGGKK